MLPNAALVGTFLCNNYKQALEILESELLVWRRMEEEGIRDDSEFDEWFDEETGYLEGLKQEPPVETLEMEYYRKLVKLGQEECVFIYWRQKSSVDLQD